MCMEKAISQEKLDFDGNMAANDPDNRIIH